jgi:LysM repeat protein
MLVNSKVEKTITLPSIQSSPNIHISYLMSPDNKTEPRKIKKSLKISKSSVFVGNDSKF